MKKYVIGYCDKCGSIVAAAVKYDEESWQNDIVEFVESGHNVSQIETDEKVILEGCRDDCPNKPYHEVKEIVPQNAGELWKYNDRFMWFTTRGISGLEMVCEDGEETETVEKMNQTIHNKNGWTRPYPPVEDENIERIEIEGVKWKNGANHISYPYIELPDGADYGIFHDVRDKNKSMKMILEIPKDSHDNNQ